MVFKVTAPEIPRYHFDFVPFSEILNATDESRLVDVIGHVVEKGVVKETIANGKKCKVTNLTLKDLENNRLHCSLWNDFVVRFHQLMDTHKSSEPSVMILQLVRLKKNSYLDGIISCDRCGEPRTAVPRYKVHLQVIDNSGSTTFTLFDRVVSRVLGRSVQNLLATMNQDLAYPPELDTFVNKRMLFKVDVTDANLLRNCRTYTVRKMTEDEEIIERFMSHHALNVVNGDNVEAGCVELGSQV
ncbi:replication protein A 70 kDa DNA-binding subunit [Trifolium repens]|nr:replication protein A 70 kDa DNA-binding subunit [Trifolium repens]